MMGCGQSIGAVLDEKIAFLAANREGMGAAQERSRSVQAREQLNESMKNAKALLDSLNKKPAQSKPSRSAGP